MYDNDEEEDVETTESTTNDETNMFGITEAPKDHPLNESGNLKIILE